MQGPIRIQTGDFLTATCRYFNKGNDFVHEGAGRTDEMCNFYMMYRNGFNFIAILIFYIMCKQWESKSRIFGSYFCS